MTTVTKEYILDLIQYGIDNAPSDPPITVVRMSPAAAALFAPDTHVLGLLIKPFDQLPDDRIILECNE